MNFNRRERGKDFIVASATDLFNAKIEKAVEADALLSEGKPGALGTVRARAVAQAVREDPDLHQKYLAEFNSRQQARRFKR